MDDILLPTYFGLQMTRNETPHDVVKAFLDTSKAVRALLRRVEVLDTISVGVSSFIRLRTDLDNPSVILERLRETRGVIQCEARTYTVKLPGGRTGPMSTLTMHAEPKPGNQRLYKGTKIKGWEDQFPV